MVLKSRKVNKSGGGGLEHTDYSVKYTVGDFFDSDRTRIEGLMNILTKERELIPGIRRQIILDFGTSEIIILFHYRQTIGNDTLIQKDFDGTLDHFENILG